MKVNSDKILKCPHCGEEQEDPAIDFTIPGHTGYASSVEEQCSSCDGCFIVENNGDGTCTVLET